MNFLTPDNLRKSALITAIFGSLIYAHLTELQVRSLMTGDARWTSVLNSAVYERLIGDDYRVVK
jgi:hypothetical protein